MNIGILSSILGRLLTLHALFLLGFSFISFIIYPYENQYIHFFSATIITFTIGIIMRQFGKVGKASIFTFREGFAIAGLGWLLIALFSSLPFILTGDIPSFTDAFFESMSGLSTTGASILTDIESKGHTILLWRSFLHWLGGMGIIVLSIALLPALGVGAQTLFQAEVSGPSPDKLVPRIQETAMILYLVYTLLSVILFLLLWFGGMPIFEAACHTWGTMGTGGFSPLNGSIGQYTSEGHKMALYFEIIITLFMFLAGINFTIHYRLIRGDFSQLYSNSELLFYLKLLGIAIIIIVADLLISKHYKSINEIIRHVTFTSVSVITTTGYVTEDFNTWPTTSRFVLLFMMFIGGCSGSTAGGLKIMRIMALSKEAIRQIKQTVHPKSIYSIKMGKGHLPREILRSLNSFVILYILIYIFAVLILSTTGLDFISVSSMAIACLSSIGPGLGKIGPIHNYAELPVYAKWVCLFLMLLGRLEIYPVIALIHPRLWYK